jgi:hypothetical protein
MGLLVLVWLLSALALIALGVRLFLLARYPDARAKARRHWLRTTIWFGLLVPASMPVLPITLMVVQYRAERAAEHAATHHRLDAPARIGGIDLPAGTLLELRRPDDRASFAYAAFPDGHTVFGVKTRRIFRDVDTRFEPDRPLVTLQIENADAVWFDGWHCKASPDSLLQALRLEVSADGASARLASCRSADGNLIDGVALPPDSWIEAVTQAPTHRQAGLRRWNIVPPPQAVFPLRGVPVYRARFQVDDSHRAVMLHDAQLACRLTLGAMTYAPGTDVSGRDEALRELPTDTWAFTNAARVAQRNDAEVEAGSWVVQSLDGRVHRIVPAGQAPRPFLRFAVADDPVPGPASPETACDEMMWSWPARAAPPPVSTTR